MVRTRYWRGDPPQDGTASPKQGLGALQPPYYLENNYRLLAILLTVSDRLLLSVMCYNFV